MKNAAIILLMLGVLCMVGCVSATARYGVENYATNTSVQVPPLNTSYTTYVGNEIFADLNAKWIDALEMSGDIKSTIPGGMGFPFNFSIKKSTLVLSYQTEEHLYFPAPSNSISADHSMFGSVLREGDEIGVRISKSNNVQEWYVDNSIWNKTAKGSTVWHREITPEDGITFNKTKVIYRDREKGYKVITYDGFYGNHFHFTLEEVTANNITSKEFIYPKEEGKPTVIGMRGCIIEIQEVNNLGIKYNVLKSF